MRKTIIKCTLIGIGFFILSFILLQTMIIQAAKPYPGEVKVEYMIVLGAGLWSDAPSPTLARRLETSLKYLEDNPQVRAVVSGGLGVGETITEAEAMKRFLLASGISQERIIMEERATNTKENIQFSKELIEEVATDFSNKVLIVTSDFHLFRAKFLAKRNGLEAFGLAAETPDSVKLLYHFREYFAFLKTLAFDRS